MHKSNSQNDQSTCSLLLLILQNLSLRRHIQLAFLLFVMLASGGAELLSLGAIIPFLSVLSSPDQLWQQPLIHTLSEKFGLTVEADLLMPITVIFAVTVGVSAAVRVINLWLNGRLAAEIGSDLSGDAYLRILYQPYSVHIQRNSSTVIKTLTLHVGRTVAALNSTLLIATSVVVALFLLTGLLLIDWIVALVIGIFIASAYGLIALLSRRRLARNSHLISTSSGQVLKAVNEGLGAIRDVLLDSSQMYYQEIYLGADRYQRRLIAISDFLVAFPRYVLESIGVIAIAFLGFLLTIQTGDTAGIIPKLGALALGAQRLLPALQQVYSGWASLKTFNADLDAILFILNTPKPPLIANISPMELEQIIQFNSVSFRYGPQSPEVLSGLTLNIRKGEHIGLVGKTGSGKSTLIDLLMGLLVPSSGKLLVDGMDIHDSNYPERLFSWRSAIAHVPQSIYLSDGSIAENIAFGIPKHQIDMERVRDAAQHAQISSFIENCKDGYNSFVGERGVRLSGGQQQRIGIARALYKKAKVLIFDEATSALDNETESYLIDSLQTLSKDITIVMVAHRISSLANCDKIITVERGQVIFT